MTVSPEALQAMLGIPAAQQPVTHYRLLGISPDTSLRDEIEAAAYRQLMAVETFRGSPWDESVEPVLQLVEEARTCLIDPVRREAYGRELQSGRIEERQPDHSGGVEEEARRQRSEWTVGAAKDCDIVIDDPFVSRRHCRIVFEGGKYWIEDLDSCNGTFIDGQRVVRRTELSLGDSISLGKTLRIDWDQILAIEAEKKDSPDKPLLVHVARRTICFADGRPVSALDGGTGDTCHEPGVPPASHEPSHQAE